MKNLKVATKLITGFLIVIVLGIIIGVVGIIGMSSLNTGAEEMYTYNTEPLTYMANVIELLQRLRVNVREYVVAVVDEAKGVADIEETHNTITSFVGQTTQNLDEFGKTIRNPEVQKLFDDSRALLTGEYAPHLNRCYEYALAGDYNAIIDELDDSKILTNQIVDNFNECMTIKVTDAANSFETNSNLYNTLLILIIVVLVVSVVAALALAFYISSLISKPLLPLTNFMKRAGDTGDVIFTPEELETIRRYGHQRDEIGQTIGAVARFVEHINVVTENLSTIASGDLTVEVKVLSEKDTMGVPLRKMTENLNNMFGEVRQTTEQVSTGAKQIADGSQTLAQGSTEQASSVQQLSSSIAEVAQKTKENADMAERAATLANTIKGNAEKGSRQMDEMMTAVKDINDASQSISKVIKTIDDIAFQTNILALNAAVEAARAGQHGKGFAVVAEEVRSLAAKSSEAAKDTGDLIANSMEKAELGSRIADETAASLAEIVSGINESSQIVTEIAHSSEEQSAGISQINKGIDQVAQVVQQNSATAEQSAASAQEMSGQSDVLQGLVEQFKLKNSGFSGARSLPSSGGSYHKSAPALPDSGGGYSGGDDLGKY